MTERAIDIDIFTGLPRKLSKGQLKKLKEAAPAQQTKPEAKQVASVVLTIDEEAEEEAEEEEEEEDEDEAELMERLAKIRAKKQAKATEKVAQARKKIAELQGDRDKTTQQISSLRDEVDEIDGKIASILDEFKLNPIQKDDDSQDDSVGGADIVPPPTAKSANQEATAATKAPTLAQKVAAAAALPPPSSTKGPSVAPAPKGKEAAASSAVQPVNIENVFMTVKGSKTFENPFVTTLISIAKLLNMKDMEPVCPATFANTIANEMIQFFAKIKDCPLHIMFCERKGCEHAKHFGNHDIFISKTIRQLKTNPTGTLQVFESVVEHLSIAGINGMFKDKKFVYDENMRDFAFHISAEYYQAIQ